MTLPNLTRPYLALPAFQPLTIPGPATGLGGKLPKEITINFFVDVEFDL